MRRLARPAEHDEAVAVVEADCRFHLVCFAQRALFARAALDDATQHECVAPRGFGAESGGVKVRVIATPFGHKATSAFRRRPAPERLAWRVLAGHQAIAPTRDVTRFVAVRRSTVLAVTARYDLDRSHLPF
ncbi:hypothetical protein [Paraburkholderia panacisoli]|uniref:hypothetical protein n=1 Tax=Paraburkholderia panacisoli TaxID=2603818 RepID=UPI00165F9873|nr:hypothetical protein [Paraburkholderia panacisoli]